MEKFHSLPTPCYVVDEAKLLQNAKLLREVADRAGCNVLLAQKAFSMFRVYPLLAQYLDGTTASGLFEAKLGHEEFGKETHVFSPAYREEDFEELTTICGHMLFNSMNQWERFGKRAAQKGVSCGLRINPEHSTQEHGIYDPCASGSRLGITLANFPNELPDGVEGLHFHTLCEQNVQPLVETLEAAEEKFGTYFSKLKWLNLGGGHHITRDDYDRELLIQTVQRLRTRYGVTVYLEPGEAVALNAGYLVTTVQDVFQNDLNLAILDTSAACHMPDVIEMPYRPPLFESGEAGELPHTYRLGGPTCLAGDIIGDYSFPRPLQIGDRLVFGDMAIYSMVKNNTFNGMPLPAIALLHADGSTEIVRQFGYADFKNRLS